MELIMIISKTSNYSKLFLIIGIVCASFSAQANMYKIVRDNGTTTICDSSTCTSSDWDTDREKIFLDMKENGQTSLMIVEQPLDDKRAIQEANIFEQQCKAHQILVKRITLVDELWHIWRLM